MDYCFNQQASLACYSLYQPLYGREPIMTSAVREKLSFVADLDDPKIWIQVLEN